MTLTPRPASLSSFTTVSKKSETNSSLYDLDGIDLNENFIFNMNSKSNDNNLPCLYQNYKNSTLDKNNCNQTLTSNQQIQQLDLPTLPFQTTTSILKHKKISTTVEQNFNVTGTTKEYQNKKCSTIKNGNF